MRSGLCHSERSRGIYLRTKRLPGSGPDVSTSLRFARHDKRRAGFTLIELLVVISVIALLMAILLPTLHRVRDQGRAVVCRAHLRQWAIIFKGYTSGSEGALHNQGFCSIAAPEFWMHWLTRNAPGTEKIRTCPMASRPAAPAGAHPASHEAAGGTFKAWGRFRPAMTGNVQVDELYHGSYSMNNWLSVPDNSGSRSFGRDISSLIIGIADSSMRDQKDAFWGSENIKGAEGIPVFADAWWWCAWPKEADTPPEHPETTDPFPCGCRDSMRRFCINRHDGFINMAFLDGAVRKVGLKELWTLKWHRGFGTRGGWSRAGGAQPADWPQWMRGFKDY